MFLTRPTVSQYTEARSDLLEGAARVFSALERSLVRLMRGAPPGAAAPDDDITELQARTLE